MATYRYSDKAIFNFVNAMKEAFPNSLFVVTGDHSNLFGSLNNTSLIQRDYTLRDTFCTVGLLQHPAFTKDTITAPIGTHMSLMPTIIEARYISYAVSVDYSTYDGRCSYGLW